VTAEIISLARVRRLRQGEDFSPIEPDIAQWKCRTPTCMTRVGVGQSAIDALALFNAALKARRERAIESHEVMWCQPCAERWHENEQLKTRGLL
jgi:hypothetical protein